LFNDDSLQEQFSTDDAFAESVARETELFFQAAATSNIDAAYRLASEARQLMLARADRWFTGDSAYWREGEDLWLTFEG
jgi:hypothetical protein